MALQSTVIKTVFGQSLVVENAYHRVEVISGNKENLMFKLVTYTPDKEEQIDEHIYDFKPDVSDESVNFIKQCYEYAKTLSEYANAINV